MVNKTILNGANGEIKGQVSERKAESETENAAGEAATRITIRRNHFFISFLS